MPNDDGSPRNLVVCCDGTNNEFGIENTNVVRLMQSLSRDTTIQCIYYDPGVGTLPLPGPITRGGQWVTKVAGLAFGAGLIGKVERAYRFLMHNHREGDAIYLFGFSRGAYTVRVLAALLHIYGLLAPGHDNLLPYVLKQFGAARSRLDKGGPKAEAWWRVCDEFRRTFSRPVTSEPDRRMPVHFLGAWDTVSSVGWAWDPKDYLFTARNPSIAKVRHAIAVDERRAFFRTNRFLPADGQDLVQLWFPGVHADVGGGYPEDEGGLWRVAFEWMLEEAVDAGLQVDPASLKAVRERTPSPERPWAERKHESLTWKWWPAEFYPKSRWYESLRKDLPHMGLTGRRREMKATDRLHSSVELRSADAALNYRPKNPGYDLAMR
jgi:uncharacterized protein (DUF2235 family)